MDANEAALLAAQVPADLAAAVRERARLNDRTVSAEIRRALRAYLNLPPDDVIGLEAGEEAA